jgi:hypothetical protein
VFDGTDNGVIGMAIEVEASAMIAADAKIAVRMMSPVAFSENIFYSQALFRTKDHLEVLAQFERAK